VVRPKELLDAPAAASSPSAATDPAESAATT
jgi:hypothetical protein